MNTYWLEDYVREERNRIAAAYVAAIGGRDSMANAKQKQVAPVINTIDPLRDGLFTHRDVTPDEIDEDPAELDGEIAAFDAGVDEAITLMQTRWAGPLSSAIVESLQELKRKAE
jgi:hypothetical protein